MPTYEYACKSCGHHLEVSQSFSEEPLTTCPTCGGDVRKVFGSIGIVLKGSGFYRNDSRAASNGKTASKDNDKKEKKDTVSSASGDSAAQTPGSSSSSSPSSPSPSTSGSVGASKAAASG
jgi:putative FmdB family regulatory protein